MNFYIAAGFSLTIGIPAIIGLWRIRRLEGRYLPFIILLCFGFCNEVTSIYNAIYTGNNILNYNIYIFIEIILIMIVFYRWQLFSRQAWLLGVLGVLVVAVWLTESFWFGSLFSFNRYSVILFSFLITLMAIFQIAFMIFFETTRLLQHSRFIICVAFILFFCSMLLIESINLYGLGLSEDFRKSVQGLFVWVNLLTNILYLIAVLWMPMKPRYILQWQSA